MGLGRSCLALCLLSVDRAIAMPGSYPFPTTPSTSNAGIVDGGPLMTVRLWGEAAVFAEAFPTLSSLRRATAGQSMNGPEERAIHIPGERGQKEPTVTLLNKLRYVPYCEGDS